MENLRLEDIWRSKLINRNWSDRAANQYIYHLSQSTIQQYNRVILNYSKFCRSKGLEAITNSECVVVEYLCQLSDASDRPKSVLTSSLSALNKCFTGVNLKPVSSEVHTFVQALIKSGTKSPMVKTPVMPVHVFLSLFNEWPSNDRLSIKDLRLKCICLLALSFMARPSDFAPRACLFDCDSFELSRFILSTDDVVFSDDGVKFTFHGIKNDYSRDGFSVSMPYRSDNEEKVDPVRALSCYIERTNYVRCTLSEKPLFLTLTRPYKAIEASSVARILNDAIDRAGLKSQGFTAKCFRPTGATNAIKLGLSSDVAKHIGRWKSSDTFEKHYVHTQVPSDYTVNLLNS